MITRKEYMQNSSELHQAYYLEIALAAGLTAEIFPADMVAQIKASTDKHLNDVSMARWDALALGYASAIRRASKERGDQYSLAQGVCTLKALARHSFKNEGA